MLIILENLMLMQKEEKRDKDNNLVYEFICFQRGVKNLITVKDIPQDLFNSTEEGVMFNLKCKMTVWGNNSSYGASFKLVELV